MDADAAARYDPRMDACAGRRAERGPAEHDLNPMSAPAPRYPMALCVSKQGDARFLAHLDFGRLIDRALRRSGLPVLCTQGFNPRFKLSYQDALPVGLGSEGEWISLVLEQDPGLAEVRRRFSAALPDLVRLVDLRRGSAPEPAERTFWRLEVREGLGSVTDALTALQARDTYSLPDPRRPERTLDVRPHLVEGSIHGSALHLELCRVQGRSLRPLAAARALEALAVENGLVPPMFGEITRLRESARPCGDETWDDDVAEAAVAAEAVEAVAVEAVEVAVAGATAAARGPAASS